VSRPGLLPWIQVAPGAPYFVTEDGYPWTPIGQNDAITWPDMRGCFRRKDLAGVERYFRTLAAHGVTCLRLMLEYAQTEHRYLEQPAGVFKPNMVAVWDDLFALAERYGLRFLLTPFDTFWMDHRWKWHPYNKANGGPCDGHHRLLACRDTRAAVKARLEFATRRWGGSGALFAWDIWNEIHPARAGDFIEDVGTHLRKVEIRVHGRAHPQTVSIFGPHAEEDRSVRHAIFRHPCLDFASTHFYELGAIDAPRNTVDQALSAGRLVREALAEIRDNRPFLDSEHGPIHLFKDRHEWLPEPFDDEYFRHFQWAHFASGAAGGGMRWPNRHPHCLTPGMRAAQRGLARFAPLIDWRTFRRANWNHETALPDAPFAAFACGDGEQALAWVVRSDMIGPDGMLRRDGTPLKPALKLPDMERGRYRITAWDTLAGAAVLGFEREHAGGALVVDTPPIAADMAFAVRKMP
jgi:hypothetical protein